jgi:Protein of unknown function (DUF4232)
MMKHPLFKSSYSPQLGGLGKKALAVQTLIFCASVAAFSQSSVQAENLHKLPACSENQLSLALDDASGNFNGMSQSGTLLVIRNTGSTTCKVSSRPTLRFENAKHHALNIARKNPPGFHPGPVIQPIAIAPGTEVAATLHWVAGDVYTGHHCLSPAFLSWPMDSKTTWRIPFKSPICGPKLPEYTQTMLQAAPAVKPAP